MMHPIVAAGPEPAWRTCVPIVDDVLRFGSLLIDDIAHEVRVGNRDIELTLREYELLRILTHNPHRVYTRTALITVLDGDCTVSTRTIDGHIRRVRAKLGSELRGCIRTVRGIGYAFTPPDGAAGEPADGPSAYGQP